MDEKDAKKRVETFYRRFRFFNKPKEIIFEDIGNENGYYVRGYKKDKTIWDAIVIDRNFSFDVLLHENIHKKLHDKGITNSFLQEFVASTTSHFFDPKILFVKFLALGLIFYSVIMEGVSLPYTFLLSFLIFISMDSIGILFHISMPDNETDEKILKKLKERD